MVQQRHEENHLQRGLNIHDKAMKHGGLLTRLHRGDGGSRSHVLNCAAWAKGVFFSLSREKSQQWSGHGEERKFYRISTKRRDRKKQQHTTQPSTFSELLVYKTKASFFHQFKVNTNLTFIVNSDHYR